MPPAANGRHSILFRVAGFGVLALLPFRVFHPHQQPGLRLLLAEVDEHLGFVFGEVVDAGVEDRVLVVADGPGGSLGLLIGISIRDENLKRPAVARLWARWRCLSII